MKAAVILVFLFLSGGKTAEAQEAIDRLFNSLDLDGDGYVSIAEAAGTPAVVERFDRGDRNRDGKLSRKEFHNLKKIKVRVAKTRKEKERSAAVGGGAPKAKPKEKDKPAAASGG